MKTNSLLLGIAFGAALAISGSQHSLAASAAWNVDNAGSWSLGTNWTPTSAPGGTTGNASTDVATFSTSLTANRTVTVDANRNIGGITFGSTSAAQFLLSGGSIKLSNGGVIQSLAGTGSSLTGNLTHQDSISSAIAIQGDGGSATFIADATTANSTLRVGAVSGVSTTGNTTTLTLTGNSTGGSNPTTASNVNGIISDGGTGKLAVVKNGTGTWVLNGANTFTGGLTLNSGILAAGNNALGNGTVTINGGALAGNSGNARSWTNAFVIGGNFTLGAAGGPGAVTMIGTMDLGSATRTITMGGATVAGNTISADISGAAGAGLTKAGTEKLTLAGNNTYSGPTTVTAGTLAFSKQVALYTHVTSNWTAANLVVQSGTTAAFYVGGTGEFTSSDIDTLKGLGTATGGFLSGSTLALDTTNGNFSYSGNIGDTNGGANVLALSRIGSGNNTLTLGGTNTYTGNTTVAAAGILRITNGSALGSTVGGTSISSGGVLELTGDIAVGNEAITMNNNGIASGGAIRNISGNNSISGNITITNASVNRINSDAGTLTLGNIARDGANRALQLGGAGNIVVNGVIDLAGQVLTKDGSGAVTLNGTNTHTGGTLLSAGTLNINKAGALGTAAGTFTISDATTIDNTSGAAITTLNSPLNMNGDFTFTGTNDLNLGTGATTLNGTGTTRTITTSAGVLTLGGAIANGTTANSLTKNGSGTLVLSGTNTYTGNTTVNAGTLSIATTGALPGFSTNGRYSVASGATLAVANAVAEVDVNTMLGTTNFLAGSIIGFDTTSANRTHSSNLTNTTQGALGLTKLGSNTLTLSGNNTYTGDTSINAGTLSVTSVNTNIGSSTINIGSGASAGALNIAQTGNETITKTINLAGTTGNASITHGNTGGLVFSSNVTSTGAGSKTLNLAGSAGGTGTISGNIVNNSGANTTRVSVLSGDWRLTGNNSFSGGFYGDGGTFRAGSDTAFGTGVITMAGANWSTIGGTPIVVANDVFFESNSSGNMGSVLLTLTGNITGSGNWSVNGFVGGKTKLSGDNSGWSGNFSFTGANQLQLNSANALGTGTTVTFSNATGSRGTLESLVAVNLAQNMVLGTTSNTTIDATFKTTANMTVAGNISGPAGNGFTKTGNATLNLTGTNSYTGNTTVSAGTLLINGDSSALTGTTTVDGGATLGGNGTLGGNVVIGANGTLSPGNSPGTLTMNGSLTLNGTATTKMEIAGIGAGQFDRIVGITALAYGGNLTLTLSGTYGTASWDLFDFGSYSADFAHVNFTGSYTGNLTLTSADTWTGSVGGQDWTFLQSSGVLSVVPEPAAWILAAFGLTTAVVFRRRRKLD